MRPLFVWVFECLLCPVTSEPHTSTKQVSPPSRRRQEYSALAYQWEACKPAAKARRVGKRLASALT